MACCRVMICLVVRGKHKYQVMLSIDFYTTLNILTVIDWKIQQEMRGKQQFKTIEIKL